MRNIDRWAVLLENIISAIGILEAGPFSSDALELSDS